MGVGRGWTRREWLVASAAGASAIALGSAPRAFAKGVGGADEVPADLTPAGALELLMQGNQRFAAGKPRGPHRSLDRVRETAPDQKPFAAVLACADSRVPVEIVFDQGFGDVFVGRVAGNVATSEQIASLEFAALQLGVKAILVLGHSSCGAVKAAMAGKEVPGSISVLFEHIWPAVHAGGDLAKVVAENVRFQAATLAQGSPTLAGLLEQGKLVIAGGVYDLSSGVVTQVPLPIAT